MHCSLYGLPYRTVSAPHSMLRAFRLCVAVIVQNELRRVYSGACSFLAAIPEGHDFAHPGYSDFPNIDLLIVVEPSQVVSQLVAIAPRNDYSLRTIGYPLLVLEAH